MGYGLGVDLGTTHTAAAIRVDGRVEPVHLGSRRPEIPSVVYLRDDGEMLVGEAAQRRGDADPPRLAREFKRRLGDPVPVLLGGAPFSAHALTARLLTQVVETVSRTQEAAPERIVVTHPANWGPYKRELLAQAAQLADVGAVTLRPEPEAAAVRFAATARVTPGEIVAVYDLGGGTFDAAVLRKTTDGFALLGEPEGIEQLGGIDFDEAILEHVRDTLGSALDGLDLADEHVTEALVRLRRDCVEAKESLSYDTEAVLGVALPHLHTRVRINRAEFEAMIGPALGETVAAMRRALRSAGIAPQELRCIVLAGGSARIPLVTELLTEHFQRPLSLDEQPELGIALGAARLSGLGDEPAGDRAAAPRLAAAGTAPAAPTSPESPDPVPLPVGAAVPGPQAAPATLLQPAADGGRARPGGTAAPVLDRLTAAGAARQPGRTDDPHTTGELRRTLARPGTRRRALRWAALAGGVAAAVVGVTAVVAWPRGDSGAASGGGFAAYEHSAATVLWRRDTGGAATGPPTVTAERVVLGGADGVIRAFRRADGQPAWTYRAGARVSVAARVAGGTVLASTAAGEILGLDAGSGARRWRRTTGTTIDAPPTVAGKHVYAGGRDGVVYRYEAAGGQHRTRVWTGGEIRTAPAVRGSVAVVAATDGRLYGSAQGRRWRTAVGRIAGAPQLVGQNACVPLNDGAVRCVRAADGAPTSRIELPGTGLARPVGGDGVVFAAGADGSVGSWDAHTGASRWRLPPLARAGAHGVPAAAFTAAPSASAPAPAPSGFPAVRAGELNVAYPDGRLLGVDAGTGVPRWELAVADTFGDAPSGDAAGVFATGSTGTLYAVRPPSPAASATGPAGASGNSSGTSPGTLVDHGAPPGTAAATGTGTGDDTGNGGVPGSAGPPPDAATSARNPWPPATTAGTGPPPMATTAPPGPVVTTTLRPPTDPVPRTTRPTLNPDWEPPTLPTPRRPVGGLVPPNVSRPRPAG
ncbi:putative pyrroloquinoline-quinone binding quinoprotein [Krasilnikovia cinnamomea]|uniref:Putative pyrroloquinoline-quinone binding quinoprotein n=1 Tax=Krasilnikovia cinnamomea TaxID=349313 RepID=A0A4Q7ZVD2_9ACTN|nr:hsp70 family protein [Krasilnikovia cinnamomea]RZU54579.1 putative pyrroloquinoline-quinone binding quinoprotein [Krasilnikovia cinnamomea]